MICVAVTYVIKSGHEDEAVALFGKLTKETRAEPGCRMYLAHRSTSDSRRFFLYEQYDDQAALDAHRASAHFQAYAAGGLFAIIESRSPEIYAPLTD
jgi:quinol monooxygenase YgiN